jgi:hypothetical protein
MQLMCEGHNLNSQNLLRDQEETIDNRLNYNLILETVNYIGVRTQEREFLNKVLHSWYLCMLTNLWSHAI